MVEYVKVCSNCGSRDIEMSRDVGYVPGLTGNERYFCRSCGQESTPLLIEDAKIDDMSQKEYFYKIALIPIDTMKYEIDSVASEIQWNKDGYVTTGRHTVFDQYRTSIKDKGYSNTIILDLKGIKTGHPNYKIMKNVVKPKYDIWLDIGIHTDGDIFDAFTLDASRVICSSICVSSIQIYEEAFDLSDHVLPCICVYDDKVQWKSSTNEVNVFKVIDRLKKIGYDEIVLIDLKHLGKNEGPDIQYASRISESYSGIIFGGGIREEDVSDISGLKLRGIMLDPEFS